MRPERRRRSAGARSIPFAARAVSRRSLLSRLSLLALAIPAGGVPGERAAEAAPAAPASTPEPAGIAHRGINYDVGTRWIPGLPARDGWSRETWTSETFARDEMRRELAVIKDDLHCTAVQVFGSDPRRLADAATFAAERGLDVWLQPRLPEGTGAETLDLLAEVAAAAERLRGDGATVVFNVGCEASVFTAGLIPGGSFEDRIVGLVTAGDRLGTYLQRLNVFLRQSRAAARSAFRGPLIYSAGPWEWDGVDWSDFDLVGLDHYRDASNAATYVDVLRDARRHGKPVVVAEFGCCTFEGAEDRGGNGYDIVDWEAEPPRLKGEFVRSEQTQADEIADLLGIFQAEGVHAAFLFTFLEDSAYSPEPRHDLDMSSFGIVKVFLPDAGHPPGYWEPKLAFHELARLYRAG